MDKKTKKDKNPLKNQVVGVIALAFAIFCLASFYVDNHPMLNHGFGPAGKAIALIFKSLVGEGRFLLGVLGLYWGIRIIRGKRLSFSNTHNGGSLILFLCIITFLHTSFAINLEWQDAFTNGYKGMGGGVLGSVFAIIFYKIFGSLGVYIVLGSLTIVALLMLANGSPQNTFKKFRSILGKLYQQIKEKIISFLFTIEDENKSKPFKKGSANDKKDLIIINHLQNAAVSEKKEGGKLPIILNEHKTSVHNGNIAETAKSLDTNNEVILEGKTNDGFQLPPFTLLSPALKLRNPRIKKDITSNVGILEETLENFGVHGKVTQVSCGPTITRYELQPAPGIKVSRIVNLSDDIALSLAASQVRIEAPIPGKSAVGIEVPNKEIATVHFREVLETEEFLASKSLLTVAFGKDIGGKPVLADLSQMPHLLIAGATGSGKSVCINSLICSLLFKCTPDQLKILMIDPKKVELSSYNGIPHLVAPVVTDPKKAAGALRWAVNEMEKRYELFAAAGVRDIARYNKLKIDNPSGNNQKLPFIVVLVDELADLMMVAPADVEDAICRLAQMARAAGIHLVVATQRPSVDVITGLIKANIPSRVAFAVSSQTDSRTILDMGGAEKLLGKGDMLLYPVGLSKPIRVQGVFVSDKEVESIVSYLKEQAEPQYNEEVINLPDTGPDIAEIDDELLPEAAKLVVEGGQASISMLQRRLRIGYNRAARLMDLLEAKGIVGGFEGSKPRNVLIGWDEYQQMFNQ